MRPISKLVSCCNSSVRGLPQTRRADGIFFAVGDRPQGHLTSSVRAVANGCWFSSANLAPAARRRAKVHRMFHTLEYVKNLVYLQQFEGLQASDGSLLIRGCWPRGNKVPKQSQGAKDRLRYGPSNPPLWLFCSICRVCLCWLCPLPALALNTGRCCCTGTVP